MKVLLFGPLTPPYNGQAVAFTTIVETFQNEEIILVNTAKFQSSVINTLHVITCTLCHFVFRRFTSIYFTSSRSSFGFLKDLPLLLLGRWSKKKVINHLHGADFKDFYNNCIILKPLVKYAYNGINTSIVLLDEMKSQYEDFSKMKIEVVGNCFSAEFDGMAEKYSKKLQLLYLSNLMRSKGILEFLDACEYLLTKYSELAVKIAGSPLRDNFMNKKTISSEFFKKFNKLKSRFPERIIFLGVVKGEEKIKLLFESSIFILPSFYPTEAYPISIIEAMRAGNAIVTTNHNYLPYFVKPENGIIVEPRSVEGIIKGIEILLQDQTKLKQVQEYNKEEAKRKYSQSRYIQQVKSIIMAK